jgi:hypothetical protein
MDRETIQSLIRAEPFEPFTVVMSNGEQFDVLHPENALLGRTTMLVARAGPHGEPADEVARLSLRQIASVEDRTPA